MFEQWVNSYDNYLLHKVVFYRAYSTVFNHTHLNPSVTILDVGCGTGEAVRFLRKKGFNGKFVGIDPSPEMIRLARLKEGERRKSSFLIAEAEALPFARSSFDCVISNFSIHHWWNPAEAIREIRRVLKPEGVFIIVDIRGNSLIGKIARNFERLMGSGFDYFECHQVEQLLTEGGFKNIRYLNTNTCFLSLVAS
ncbi:class I SAM-dependent methyltransferase [Anoxybacillus sp. J5B_2022]|uniref:class I SAM-dependent methyltransferase n=1 Tax=Anoxybacillus sp. J5B_2022 TaxID=3003246 RepID=UPI002286469F|nr:class I SAM-dependent methyltransferase [Anoxybacillus sp. J5B_2022]MCZ0754131.1 class I SAM-dependent methyltransferase [Anoxybacillus sp. J5B_2022]